MNIIVDIAWLLGYLIFAGIVIYALSEVDQ